MECILCVLGGLETANTLCFACVCEIKSNTKFSCEHNRYGHIGAWTWMTNKTCEYEYYTLLLNWPCQIWLIRNHSANFTVCYTLFLLSLFHTILFFLIGDRHTASILEVREAEEQGIVHARAHSYQIRCVYVFIHWQSWQREHQYGKNRVETERESHNQWMESKNYHFCVVFIASRSQTMNKHIRFDHKFQQNNVKSPIAKQMGSNIARFVCLCVCTLYTRQW